MGFVSYGRILGQQQQSAGPERAYGGIAMRSSIGEEFLQGSYFGELHTNSALV